MSRRATPRKLQTSSRRAAGQLEGDVLSALWSTDSPMTPAEVLESVGGDLAYNTVMTTLTRLHDKGVVAREKRGRAYAYRPSPRASDHAADRMRAALEAGGDHAGVLQRFVADLSPDDEQALRELIRAKD